MGEDLNMPAHLIVDIKVTDRTKFKEYAKAVQNTVGAFGGRYLCRWGRPETLEGKWDARRIIIVEFETLKQAKEWWASEEYRPLKSLRRDSSTARIILVESV